jgi:uncharacterized protein (DUF1800 family)
MPIWDEDNAAHLLSRAGFGGDSRDVRRFFRYGHERAVDKLLLPTPVDLQPPAPTDAGEEADSVDMQVWWLARMATEKTRRLHEKMALFWHDHFATSISVVQNVLWMAKQNRLFRLYGLGSFRTLVYEVTVDPAMLDFLDLRQSTKNKPNENYPRELMELFTLGVSDLDGADNYTQQDVEELTRALTGFQIQDDAGIFNPARFDGGTKTLFEGQPIASGNLRLVDDAGNLIADPNVNVIDILFAHRDSDGELTMPRYLARKLWEYFAYPLDGLTLTDKKALLDSLTGDFIAGGFVVADLLRAIFMHEEFYGDTAKSSTVKNPCEFAVGAIRALKVQTDASPLPALLTEMGMELFNPPGVNGWNNGLPWLSSGQFLNRINCAHTIAQGNTLSLNLKITKLYPRRASTSAEVVDAVLGKLHLTVPAGVRQSLIDYLEPFASPDETTWAETKVRELVELILALPEALVH